MPTVPLRIAVVGCGAVSRESLLPVLAGYDRVQLAALIDRDHARARALADAYGVATVLTDIDQLLPGAVDGVVLATPPAHHAPATIALAARGLHVMVEKPMAIAAHDARAMVEAAHRAGVVLSVGLYRRFLPSVQLLKTMIEGREFGRVVSVDAEEGGPYGWPLATLDGLRRSSGGGGVLIDIGSHVIDVILYVLQATPRLVSYSDNDRGGIETDCVLEAALAHATGEVPLRLELSRTRELRGSIVIRCEDATLELKRAAFTSILVHRHAATPASPIQLSASWAGADPNFLGYEAFRREMEDWVEAILASREPVLSGRSVLPVVALIEDAYSHRTPLEEPTDDTGHAPAVHTGAGKARRVLVTGAGGFLGGRVVEMLRNRADIVPVPVVREPKGASRLARWPDEILLGDVCSRSDMDRVLKGCDAVVHCAVGTSWKPDEVRRVTVDGTRTIAEAAQAAGVTRFVHISTLFVHNRKGTGEIDESTPLDPPSHDHYGQTKLAAEKALAEIASKGLTTFVLRPTRIYGPFSRTFTVRPLLALTEGRLAIGGSPDVPGNMVYVDNVVGAIEHALDADSALGGAYLITDSEQGTLREFYEYFGRPWGLVPRLRPEWREDAGTAAPGWLASLGTGVKTIAKSPELRGFVRRVFETDPIGTLPRRLWERSPQMQQRLLTRFGSDAAVVYRPPTAGGGDELVYVGEDARVSGRKALQALGSERVPMAVAMERTLAWARYARVLPHAKPTPRE